MKCKFPDKDCNDRFECHGTRQGKFCRLPEWKKKSGVCPYDKKITSKNKSKKVLKELGQLTL